MKNYLYFSFVLLAIQSCNTVNLIQHTPPMVQVGLHTAKNQLNARAMITNGSSFSNDFVNETIHQKTDELVLGGALQASYSINNSLAVQTSFMHNAENYGFVNNGKATKVYEIKRNLGELGLAYYAAIDAKKTWFFEIAGGMGYGKFTVNELASPTLINGRYYNHSVMKEYVQPSIYTVKHNYKISTGAKISFLQFNGIKTNYTNSEKKFRSLTEGNRVNASLLEWHMRLDIPVKKLPWLGFTLQSQITKDLNGSFNFNHNDINFGGGIHISLATALKHL